jgi:chemotaxis protein CheC
MAEQLNEVEADILREIGNIGSGNAATSLETWLGMEVSISVSRAALAPLEYAADHLGNPFETVVGIHSTVSGEMRGSMLYIFSVGDSRGILKSLLDEEYECAAFTPESISALSETANIAFSSYVNALYDLTDLGFDLTPPTLLVDMLAAVVNDSLSGLRTRGKYVLLLETEFTNDGFISCPLIILITDYHNYRRLLERAREDAG